MHWVKTEEDSRILSGLDMQHTMLYILGDPYGHLEVVDTVKVKGAREVEREDELCDVGCDGDTTSRETVSE